MSKLQCTDCEAVFGERDADTYTERDKSEAWGVVAYHENSYLCCPECGGKELEDYQEVEDESDFDFAKIEAKAKERMRDEFTRTLINIALAPWRKQA